MKTLTTAKRWWNMGLVAGGLLAALVAVLLAPQAVSADPKDITATFHGGILTVDGTSGGDIIIVRCASAVVTLDTGGGPSDLLISGATVSCSAVKSLGINGHHDDDTLDAQGVTSDKFTSITHITLNGQEGDDTCYTSPSSNVTTKFRSC